MGGFEPADPRPEGRSGTRSETAGTLGAAVETGPRGLN